MMKILFLLLVLLTKVYGCELHDKYLSNSSKNNLQLLSQYSPLTFQECLKQTFRIFNHYEKNHKSLEEKRAGSLIPKMIHFIFLEDIKFQDFEILASWKEKNPQFEICVWVEKIDTLPPGAFTIRNIKELSPLRMEKEYREASNCEEKSQILRLEILEKFGGIYANSDLECLCSFDSLVENCTFFAGASEIVPMVNQHFFHIPNGLIGASQNHTIIRKTIEILQKKWTDRTEKIKRLGFLDFHPERTYENLLILTRTFLPLSEAVFATQLTANEFILPPYFFDSSQTKEREPMFVKQRVPLQNLHDKKLTRHEKRNIRSNKMLAKCQEFSLHFFIVLVILNVYLSLLCIKSYLQNRKKRPSLIKHDL